MIIDGHAHACGEYLTIESLVNKIKFSGIDKVVLVPGKLGSSKTYHLINYSKINKNMDMLGFTNRLDRMGFVFKRTKGVVPKGNEYVFQLSRKLPDRIIQFFWVTEPQIHDLDDKYSQMAFRGIKLHQCWEYFPLHSEFFHHVAEWATRKEIPVFVHLYSHRDVAELIKYIKGNRNIIVIVGHLFGSELFMQENPRHLENVYFDISNNYFISYKRLEKALRYFGSQKLILGSDTPFGEKALEQVIQRVSHFNITIKEKEMILGENLRRMLSI